MKFYCNPVKKQGDFADPFVLRYNGKYYLYATNPDVRCWSSDDLVTWQLEGPAIEPDAFPELVPFAPEVVYWNGAFYMYTSPHGLGHYVLKSERVTGPFRKITGNVGHCIDGSVFIDDDGKWYFYWADDSGIMGCEMSSPIEFGPPVNIGAFMHGWTEGPLVVKEDGIYYLTYTGNHYLSKGYRINAATSKHPLAGYVDCVNNPVIVHTEEPWVGLGHSSTVYGPDMLTRYIVYHNINPDRTRDLNIDAVVLDGNMRVLGPANFPQYTPALPDFSDDMVLEGNWDVLKGKWEMRDGLRVSSGDFQCLCRHTLAAAPGVVEFNLRVMDGEGTYGVNVGGLRLALNTASNKISLLDSGGKLLAEYAIPWAYAHDSLYCLQFRYGANRVKLYLNGIKATECEFRACAGDRIGYYSEAPSLMMSYTAINMGDTQTAAAQLFIPVPCRIPLKGKAQEKLNLNVAKTTDYIFAVTCKAFDSAQADLALNVDGNDVKASLVAASRDIAMYALVLTQGLHEVSVELGSGLYAPAELSIFEAGGDGSVTAEVNGFGPYDKRCWGGSGYAAFEAGLELQSGLNVDVAAVGIIFRASELSLGGEGDDKELGINFFIGYCVSLERHRVVLTRHRYDEKELCSESIDAEDIRSLRVRTDVNDIRVYVNNDDVPILEFHDPSPILSGQTGMRVKGCEIDHAVFYTTFQ
jgi:hypothetical protein